MRRIDALYRGEIIADQRAADPLGMDFTNCPWSQRDFVSGTPSSTARRMIVAAGVARCRKPSRKGALHLPLDYTSV